MSTISTIEYFCNKKKIPEELRVLIFSYVEQPHPMKTIFYKHCSRYDANKLYLACINHIKGINYNQGIIEYCIRKYPYFRTAIEDNQELIDKRNAQYALFAALQDSMEESDEYLTNATDILP